MSKRIRSKIYARLQALYNYAMVQQDYNVSVILKRALEEIQNLKGKDNG